jgi:hypothetical protein
VVCKIHVRQRLSLFTYIYLTYINCTMHIIYFDQIDLLLFFLIPSLFSTIFNVVHNSIFLHAYWLSLLKTSPIKMAKENVILQVTVLVVIYSSPKVGIPVSPSKLLRGRRQDFPHWWCGLAKLLHSGPHLCLLSGKCPSVHSLDPNLSSMERVGRKCQKRWTESPWSYSR